MEKKKKLTISTINDLFGKINHWLLAAMVVISAGNAISRKFLNISSNGWLEIQWYLFSGIVLLGLGYTMKENAHIRIDFFSSKISEKKRAFLEVLSILFILFPISVFIIMQSIPITMDAFSSGETSSNAGGLIRWPFYAILPLGFFLLLLQGISSIAKNIGTIAGSNKS